VDRVGAAILAKLGNALYWLGCIGAAAMAIFVGAFVVLDPRPDSWSMASSDLGWAIAIWITGFVLKTLLS